MDGSELGEPFLKKNSGFGHVIETPQLLSFPVYLVTQALDRNAQHLKIYALARCTKGIENIQGSRSL
jgi:hypothetical protein